MTSERAARARDGSRRLLFRADGLLEGFLHVFPDAWRKRRWALEAIAARVEAIALRLEILETISIGFPYASSLEAIPKEGRTEDPSLVHTIELPETTRTWGEKGRERNDGVYQAC